jgi:superfamily II RNA helicase
VTRSCRSVKQLYLTLYCIAGHCVILQNRYEEGEVAWDIIKKGPERLQSQFAAGYGMVLNLLYSRSLDEAKAFIDRSFNSYLSKVQLHTLILADSYLSQVQLSYTSQPS